MSEKKELWKNLTKGEVWIKVFDVKGIEKAKRVPPGGSIQITSEERRLNQEIAYGPEGDVFKNGRLTVSDFAELADVAEDLEELREGSLSESEIAKMLDQNTNSLKKDLAKIGSPITLSVLKEIVEDEELARIHGISDVSVAKANAVQARYDELVPPTTRQQFEDFEDASSVKPRKL